MNYYALAALVAACSFPTAALAQTTAAAATDSPNVAVVVRIAAPAGVSRERIVQLMRTTVPHYEMVPGLVRKYFTLADDNAFGGVYIFRDRAAAEHEFSPAWFAGVKKQWGVDANVFYLAAPIAIDGKNAL